MRTLPNLLQIRWTSSAVVKEKISENMLYLYKTKLRPCHIWASASDTSFPLLDRVQKVSHLIGPDYGASSDRKRMPKSGSSR